ncbi:unnamed protein product [Sphagnum jensenii]|uniref:Uncharacterized protein n=1 Tax=Sphagnum jensenii TaxID=128206 RepID=A0ABP1BVP2_9BRYO
MEAHQNSEVPYAFPSRYPLEADLGPPLPGPVFFARPNGRRLMPVDLHSGGCAEGREDLLSFIQVRGGAL